LALKFRQYGYLLLCGLLMTSTLAYARPGSISSQTALLHGEFPYPASENSIFEQAEDYPQTCSVTTEIKNTFLRLYPNYNLSAETTTNVLKFTSFSATAQSIDLRVSSENETNAWAVIDDLNQKPRASITVSTRLLNQLRNRSELAFVIAHEMSHVLARHKPMPMGFLVLSKKQEERIAAVHRNWEMFADRQASLLLHSAGYNVRQASSLLRRIEHFEKKSAKPNHPSIQQRITALDSFYKSAMQFPKQTASLSSSLVCTNCKLSDNPRATGAEKQ
jgi:hypothetical protein